jgi:hypothetical protein
MDRVIPARHLFSGAVRDAGDRTDNTRHVKQHE